MACDGVVCCLGCLSFLPGVKKKLVNQVAFSPPQQAGYRLIGSQTFLCVTGNYQPLPDLKDEGVIIDTVRMETDRENTIYAFHYRVLNATKTIVFSHGNSTDIGFMFTHLTDMALKLKANIVSYDYSGYGASSGQPAEKNLYSDIDAVYRYLTCDLGIDPQSIILYGQSVGSAPTVDLASRELVGGIVIHSGLKSGLSVLHDVKTTHWFDVFQNLEKIRLVRCPVFCIHGVADMEVTFDHGQALYDAAPNTVEPWWVQHGGHNNIEVGWRSEYFTRLSNFLNYLESSNTMKRLSSYSVGGPHHRESTRWVDDTEEETSWFPW